jgi:hypothetical protein
LATYKIENVIDVNGGAYGKEKASAEIARVDCELLRKREFKGRAVWQTAFDNPDNLEGRSVCTRGDRSHSRHIDCGCDIHQLSDAFRHPLLGRLSGGGIGCL